VSGVIEPLIQRVFSGGPEAIIAVLMLGITLLLFERKRLLDQLAKKEEKMEKIVDDYYRGNITLSEALNNLKGVLYEIKGKINP
jgi:hypothetical protein